MIRFLLSQFPVMRTCVCTRLSSSVQSSDPSSEQCTLTHSAEGKCFLEFTFCESLVIGLAGLRQIDSFRKRSKIRGRETHVSGGHAGDSGVGWFSIAGRSEPRFCFPDCQITCLRRRFLFRYFASNLPTSANSHGGSYAKHN